MTWKLHLWNHLGQIFLLSESSAQSGGFFSRLCESWRWRCDVELGAAAHLLVSIQPPAACSSDTLQCSAEGFSFPLSPTLIRPHFTCWGTATHLPNTPHTHTHTTRSSNGCTSVLLFWENQYQVKNKLLPWFYSFKHPGQRCRGKSQTLWPGFSSHLLTDLKASETLNWKGFTDIWTSWNCAWILAKLEREHLKVSERSTPSK